MPKKCIRIHPLTGNESFLPFKGSREELKQDPTFRQVMEKSQRTIVRHGVTYCSKTDEGKMQCRKGVSITKIG